MIRVLGFEVSFLRVRELVDSLVSWSSTFLAEDSFRVHTFGVSIALVGLVLYVLRHVISRVVDGFFPPSEGNSGKQSSTHVMGVILQASFASGRVVLLVGLFLGGLFSLSLLHESVSSIRLPLVGTLAMNAFLKLYFSVQVITIVFGILDTLFHHFPFLEISVTTLFPMTEACFVLTCLHFRYIALAVSCMLMKDLYLLVRLAAMVFVKHIGRPFVLWACVLNASVFLICKIAFPVRLLFSWVVNDTEDIPVAVRVCEALAYLTLARYLYVFACLLVALRNSWRFRSPSSVYEDSVVYRIQSHLWILGYALKFVQNVELQSVVVASKSYVPYLPRVEKIRDEITTNVQHAFYSQYGHFSWNWLLDMQYFTNSEVQALYSLTSNEVVSTDNVSESFREGENNATNENLVRQSSPLSPPVDANAESSSVKRKSTADPSTTSRVQKDTPPSSDPLRTSHSSSLDRSLASSSERRRKNRRNKSAKGVVMVKLEESHDISSDDQEKTRPPTSLLSDQDAIDSSHSDFRSSPSSLDPLSAPEHSLDEDEKDSSFLHSLPSNENQFTSPGENFAETVRPPPERSSTQSSCPSFPESSTNLGDQAVLESQVDPLGLFQLCVLFPNYFEISRVNEFIQLSGAFDSTVILDPQDGYVRAAFYYQVSHFIDLDPPVSVFVEAAPVWKILLSTVSFAVGSLWGISWFQSLDLLNLFSSSQ